MTSDEPEPSLSRVKLREALWPLMMTLVIMATGMAYSLWWAAIVRHKPWYWVVPADIWLEVRDAHYVGWGGLSFIYSARTALVTLPGFAVVMWPVVTLSSALGLSESAPILQLTKPQAWLVVGPFSLAMAGVGLFALDALARRLGVAKRLRHFLTVIEGVALFPTVALWGHPEDVVALAFATFALILVFDRRWTGVGWLLGIAIAMQLFVVALVPLIIGLIGWRKATAVLARAAIIPGFFLVAVLVPNFHGTVKALLNQPNFPRPNFPTPWILLAPKLSSITVAAGPGRLIGFAVAVAAAFPAYRWRGRAGAVVWLASAVLGARCLFESVMDPYYVMPAVVLAIVAGALRGRTRCLLTCAAGLGLTVMLHFHMNMWPYWFEMAALMGAMLAFAWPPSMSKASAEIVLGDRQADTGAPTVSLPAVSG